MMDYIRRRRFLSFIIFVLFLGVLANRLLLKDQLSGINNILLLDSSVSAKVSQVSHSKIGLNVCSVKSK